MLSALRSVRDRVERFALERHRRSILKVVRGGEGLHLDGKVLFVHAERLTLGRNVHIGHGACFNCLGGITVGDHTIISGQVTIYSYDHAFKRPSRLPYDDEVTPKPVYIGRYVWIGMNVTIAPGTIIEDGAVIGIGTVVSGHIPANAIVVSPKPRVVGYRDESHTRALAQQERFYLSAAA
ncbi:MAG: acyltransferase [Planctomycetes bacterium]|nr:acyltransferase [Planctomycetota bacterium]